MHGLKAVLLDMDGVLYNAETPIAGSAAAVRWLREHAVPHLFVTNTTSRGRAALVEKLRRFGIPADETQILTPCVAAAAWLRTRAGSAALFVRPSARCEFDGLPIAPDDAEQGADFVVVGDLGEHWDYRTLNRAFRLLHANPNAQLIALGMTRYWQTADGVSLDVAPFVAALEHATGREAFVLGKPAPAFFAAAAAQLRLAPEEILMVGDDIDTDVRGAQEAGMKGALVGTGKFRPSDLERGAVPDFIFNSVADLPRCWNQPASSDTAPVREGERLNAAALADYLRGKLEGIGSGLRIEQFPGGHSNLTYLLAAGEREYVLRRGPLGPVPPKAHDMAREYKILRAVHPLFPPAPEAYLLCEDPSVAGAVFFVMERRNGVVLHDTVPPEIAAHPGYAERISEAFVDCLIQLHSIDIQAHGLAALGKPDGFLERQVRGWAGRWDQAKTEDLPQIERTIAWLAAHVPVSGAPSLVHNDYKLDNIMFGGARTARDARAGEEKSSRPAALCAELDKRRFDRIEAVLDWEMATVGDPLADLGLTLCYWTTAADPEVSSAGVPAISAGPGWYTRDQFIEQYARRTGRDVSRIAWYEILGVFKLAVILQQIYFRFHAGQTSDERFRHFDGRVRKLAAIAGGLVERAG